MVENLIQILIKNMQKYVKKFSLKSENSLAAKNKEAIAKIELRVKIKKNEFYFLF